MIDLNGFACTCASPEAVLQYTSPLSVRPHIEAAVSVVDGVCWMIWSVAATLVNRTGAWISSAPWALPQQYVPPSLVRPHVPWAADTATSCGTPLTRCGTELQAVST